MRESVRAEIRQVADGLVFPEGPVWHPDGYLLFSDVHGATIERLKPDGGTATWWSVGKKTNGLILSPDRRKIIACCYSERELLEIDAETREYRVITRECDGRPYVNVNDVAADSNGFIYFSDPKWNPAPDDVQGVYCVRPDGTVFLAAHLDQLARHLVPTGQWIQRLHAAIQTLLPGAEGAGPHPHQCLAGARLGDGHTVDSDFLRSDKDRSLVGFSHR